MWIIFFICSALYYSCEALEFHSAASVFFHLQFAASIVWAVVFIFKNRSTIFKKPLFWLASVVIVLSFINVTVGVRAGISVGYIEYIKKLLLFCSTIIIIYISFNSKILINRLSDILCLIFVQAVFFSIAYQGYFVCSSFVFGERPWLSVMTLGFSHPNAGGMCALLCGYTLFIFATKAQNRILKIFLIIESLLSLDLVIRTGSRASLMAAIVFIILFIVFKINALKKFAHKYLPLVSGLILSFPAIFPIIYFVLYKNRDNLNLLNTMQIQGKEIFGGRLSVWSRAMKNWIGHPIFGAYNQISNGTGASQMHDIYIDILASYGVVVLILTLALFVYIVIKQSKKKMCENQTTAFLMFLSIFINGAFEAQFVCGCLCWCLFLLLANAEEADNSEPQCSFLPIFKKLKRNNE